jgi:predicted membrane protein
MFSSNESRMAWTYRVLLLGVLCTLILAGKVWISDRNFPVVPIISGLPALPSPLDKILYYILIVLCTYQLVSIENIKTRKILTGLYVFLLLLDQMRWQPYNVHYMIMLIGFLFYPARSEQVIQVFRLMVITFFIWTGIQDFNQVFADKVYPFVWAKRLAELLPYRFEGYVTGSGYLFALLHLVTGLGLLFQRSRNAAVLLGILIHLFLFYAADPFGNDINRVAPLYNLISAAFCFILFYNVKFDYREIFWSKEFRYHQAIVVFYTVLPLLSFFGLYDRMQSFNMYSGKGWYAKIYVTEALVEKLPEGMKRYVDRPFGSEPYIETTYWAWKELKVSPYNEKRVFENLHEYVCSFAEGDCTARLEFYTY